MNRLNPIPLVAFLCLTCMASLISTVSCGQACSFLTKSITHDTIVSGTGNDYFSITLPKFDPSNGTLVSVNIKSLASIGYNFQVENNLLSSSTFSVGIGRNDYIGNTVLSNGYYMHLMQKNYGPYTLAASDGVADSGPDYFAQGQFNYLNSYPVISDSITDLVAGFIGTGTISFDYFPTTYSIVPGNKTYTFQAFDTMQFSISYYYCSNTTLPSAITGFNAVKNDARSVKLNWTNEGEWVNADYALQKSSDGNVFETFATVHSAPATNGRAAYAQLYHALPGENTLLYFRLKETGTTGAQNYSEVKKVDLSDNSNSGISLYPNPSRSFINIRMPFSGPHKYQADVLSANGALIQSQHSTSALLHIDFKNVLNAGVYFVRTTDLDSRENHVLSFIVQ